MTVPAGRAGELADLAARHGVPLTELGTTGGDTLVVRSADLDEPLAWTVAELHDTWTATLPAALA